MDQLFSGKSVPWLELKSYFDIHERIINFEKMIKSGDLSIPDVEARLPKPLFQIHQEITKILKERNILIEADDTKLSQL